MKKLVIVLLIVLCSCSKINRTLYGDTIVCDNVTAHMMVSKPNSAGGCTITLTITNNSGKTIKKINCEGVVKNYYKEPVQCTISGKYWASFYPITGPIYNNTTASYNLVNKFYNSSACYIDIGYIEIYYENGTFKRK